MKHTSNHFPCPVGGLMIFALYNEESKQLSLEEAPGYFYPSSGSNDAQLALSREFMKENTMSFESLEEAMKYLKELGCDIHFSA